MKPKVNYLKKYSYYSIYLIGFIMIFHSCSSDLDESHINIINFAEIEDTLIFKSSDNDFDSILVVDKGTYYQKLNPIFGNTWYRPQDAYLKVRNLNFHNQIDYDLVHIYGKNPSYQVRISIELRVFYCFMTDKEDSLGIIQKNNLDINNVKYSNYYILNKYCKTCEVDSCSINSVYWSVKHGPLKFIDKDSIEWIRVK